jgi:hypothetical protein
MQYVKLANIILCILLAGCSLLSAAKLDGIATMQIDGEQMFSVADLAEVSPIAASISNDQIVLCEDGLEVSLAVGSKFIYRHGLIVDSLSQAPVKLGEKIYVPVSFLKEYLTGGQDETLSLYHGASYLGSEILAALREPHHEKILAAVELPRSFDISIPKIDVGRVIQTVSLRNLPAIIAEDLEHQGYDNALDYTYGEYEVISGTQTLQEAALTSVINSYPELNQIDVSNWTVKDYWRWERAHTKEQQAAMYSETEKKLMREKNIQIDDMAYLRKEFYDAVFEQSDEVLKTCLESYYQLTIALLTPSSAEVI